MICLSLMTGLPLNNAFLATKAPHWKVEEAENGLELRGRFQGKPARVYQASGALLLTYENSADVILLGCNRSPEWRHFKRITEHPGKKTRIVVSIICLQILCIACLQSFCIGQSDACSVKPIAPTHQAHVR